MSLLSSLMAMGSPSAFNGPRFNGRSTVGGVPYGPEPPANQLINPIVNQLQQPRVEQSPTAATQPQGGMSPSQLLEWLERQRSQGLSPPVR